MKTKTLRFEPQTWARSLSSVAYRSYFPLSALLNYSYLSTLSIFFLAEVATPAGITVPRK